MLRSLCLPHCRAFFTNRHHGIAPEARYCQMYNHRILNSGLPAAQFNGFVSGEDANDPIEIAHHDIFTCSGYVYATFKTCSASLSQLSASSLAKSNGVVEPERITPEHTFSVYAAGTLIWPGHKGECGTGLEWQYCMN